MKTTTKTNATNFSSQRFHSALTAGFLALLTCATLTPKIQANRHVNYIDGHPATTNPETNNSNPEDRWFY